LARRTYSTCYKEEAIEETEKMLGVYADICRNFMAMPVLKE
jgi:hypothetical protein